MRFNSCELKQLAKNSTDCTKEGILHLRQKEGKLWNKTDGILSNSFTISINVIKAIQ